MADDPLPFRRCHRCQNECHISYTACPSCKASFDDPAQAVADRDLRRELHERTDTQDAAQRALDDKRLRDARETGAALENLREYERYEARKESRFIGDLLSGEPFKHLGKPLELDAHDRAMRRRDRDRYHGPRAPRQPEVPAGPTRLGSVVAALGFIVAFVGVALLLTTADHRQPSPLAKWFLLGGGAAFVAGLVLNALSNRKAPPEP